MTTSDFLAVDPTGVDLLHDVARRVESTWLPDPHRPPTPPYLVAVDVAGPGVRLARVPLAGDPCAALRGATAPPSWWSVGVVAAARQRVVPSGRAPAARVGGEGVPDTGAPSSGEDDGPILLVHLVARSGASVTVRHTAGARSPARWHESTGSPSSGALDDHLRRVLGLPTAPPPPSTAGWWTALWLDALLRATAAGEPPVATWPAAAALHPVAALARRAGAAPPLLDWIDDHLERAADLLARRWSWAALRAWAANGAMAGAGVDGRTAAWMDDGLFARTLLARAAGPAGALDDLAELLPAGVHERVSRACAGWGVTP